MQVPSVKLNAMGIKVYGAGAPTVKENLDATGSKISFKNFPCIMPVVPIREDADINSIPVNCPTAATCEEPIRLTISLPLRAAG